ncbi:hypothetical protein GCM10022397_02470 [Flavivirga jejuensis]
MFILYYFPDSTLYKVTFFAKNQDISYNYSQNNTPLSISLSLKYIRIKNFLLT